MKNILNVIVNLVARIDANACDSGKHIAARTSVSYIWQIKKKIYYYDVVLRLGCNDSITSGAVMLDLESSKLSDLANSVVGEMLRSGQIRAEDQGHVLRALLSKHKSVLCGVVGCRCVISDVYILLLSHI